MRNYKVKDECIFIFNDSIFKIMVVICLIISLTANAPLMSMLCICILALSFGTKTWASAGLKNLTAVIKLDGIRSFPEDAIHSSIIIQNKKVMPVFLKIELSKNNIENLKMESGILSYGKITFDLDISYEKRGVYTLGPLYISAFDLLGFYSVSSNFAGTREIIVYPRLIPLKEYFCTSREYFGNNNSNSFVEDPVLVTGTREYSSDRSSKNIHWKASARTMILQEKMFAPSSHINLVIIIDVKCFNESQALEEFETMLSVAASLAVELSKLNIMPGLIVNGSMNGDHDSELFSVDGSDSVYLILEKLARLSVEYRQDYDAKIQELNFNGNISYIYFCYSPDEKMISLKNKGASVEIVTCKQNNFIREKIYNIYDLIEIGDNK